MTVGNHHAEFRTGLLLQVVAQPCCCGVWVFWQKQSLLLVLMVDILLVYAAMGADNAQLVAND